MLWWALVCAFSRKDDIELELYVDFKTFTVQLPLTKITGKVRCIVSMTSRSLVIDRLIRDLQLDQSQLWVWKVWNCKSIDLFELD